MSLSRRPPLRRRIHLSVIIRRHIFTATITIGTNYAWTNTETLTGEGNDNVTSLPYTITPVATAKQTTDYVLSVENAGCPNLLAGYVPCPGAAAYSRRSQEMILPWLWVSRCS